MVQLRAELPTDLALLPGGASEFDDFGPRGLPGGPASPRLDGDGALTILDDNDHVVGDVTWHWRRWGPTAGSQCPMVGIWLRPEHRRRGLGTAAQKELVELFFRHTTTNRIEAHTDVENIGEQRALEAAGFTREGVVRGGQWRDGAFRDGYLYAILRDDPR